MTLKIKDTEDGTILDELVLVNPDPNELRKMQDLRNRYLNGEETPETEMMSSYDGLMEYVETHFTVALSKVMEFEW